MLRNGNWRGVERIVVDSKSRRPGVTCGYSWNNSYSINRFQEACVILLRRTGCPTRNAFKIYMLIDCSWFKKWRKRIAIPWVKIPPFRSHNMGMYLLLFKHCCLNVIVSVLCWSNSMSSRLQKSGLTRCGTVVSQHWVPTMFPCSRGIGTWIPLSSAYRDVCVSSVDIPTPTTHTSNSVQSCAPGPTTTLQ